MSTAADPLVGVPPSANATCSESFQACEAKAKALLAAPLTVQHPGKWWNQHKGTTWPWSRAQHLETPSCGPAFTLVPALLPPHHPGHSTAEPNATGGVLGVWLNDVYGAIPADPLYSYRDNQAGSPSPTWTLEPNATEPIIVDPESPGGNQGAEDSSVPIGAIVGGVVGGIGRHAHVC